MRIQTLVGFQAVEVSSRQGEKQFDLEPQRYRSKKLQGHTSAQQ